MKFVKGQIPWNKGKSFSKESIEKMKKSHLGQKAWNKGKGSSFNEVKTRFETKIEYLSNNCWKWLGFIESNGYGRFHHLGNPISAHRFSYMLYRGPIDIGLTIDHLCKNKWCVNPMHLEVVTIAENLLRSNSISTINKKKEYCSRGHEYDLVNTYNRPDGGRDCRICHSILQKQYLENKKRGVDVP